MKPLKLLILRFRMKLARWTKDWEHYFNMACRIEELGIYSRERHPNEAIEDIWQRYNNLNWKHKDEFWRNSKP